MLVNPTLVDIYVKLHVAELQREVEHDRLVDLALGPARPFRFRLAEWLHAAAERIASLGLPTVLVQEGGYLSDDLGRNLVRFLKGFEKGR